MFVAYAIPIGLLAGWLGRGHLDGLATIRLRWRWLIVGGLAVQVLLFASPVGALLGPAVPVAYAGSAGGVLVAVLANRRVPGLAIVAVGAAANLAAILANGGYMPFDPSAAAAAGLGELGGPTNSIELAEPALRPLTDIFAMPAGLPLANVFSVGDVLIGLGVAWAIAAAMRVPVPAATARRPLGRTDGHEA